MAIDQGDSIRLASGGTATAGGPILGGNYGLAASFVSSGGTVVAQIQGPDGASWITAATVSPGATSSGYTTVELPPGQARISANAGGTTISAAMTRVPS